MEIRGWGPPVSMENISGMMALLGTMKTGAGEKETGAATASTTPTPRWPEGCRGACWNSTDRGVNLYKPTNRSTTDARSTRVGGEG